ncbi:2-succinyl-5-enolpyruvyl-6-hydroxy-3-cyclohexene-1-carboxylic-acid synthase [Micromonospora ureilytica]|uniref:2-succinyl-5-enolpyruvyl-6-hydroxy-3- cyclohexene-1-carboxylic-acid synthase n=1 Tax=Micromonospora ureilytica TaxID=709868 RepID=UPI002E124626|nr:2-succinyl-5-enolpyruvyl-6-hydroxy-3-cyclohexene-1-carboxylic-acid synthase [Micromonospora ureilytica]
MHFSDPLTSTVADELARCGVTDVVASPGLHSGVLAHAVHQCPGMRLHVRIDERSAAFLALGLARASGRPAAVVCTSGTAAANLHPAVLEARHSRVPLVVITTDRLPALRGTGANQATDQVRLYGTATPHYTELNTEPPTTATVRYWRSAVSRAVGSCAHGPVHLNLGLHEPYDAPAPLADEAALLASARPPGEPWTLVRHAPEAPRTLDVPAHGVIVVGDGASDPHAAVTFAEQAGWPLLAEPQSGARYGANAIRTYGDLLSHREFRKGAEPEMVITMGRPGVHLAVLDYLGQARDHLVVDPSADWADPTRGATEVLSRLGTPRLRDQDPDWLRRWQDADKAAGGALDVMLDRTDLSEPRIARDLVAAIPDGSLLFAGSSMPIRDLEQTMRPRQNVRILANRGLNGIDGAVSSAIGAALAHQAQGGGRAYALLGDLSLLHDQNGLITGLGSPRPDLTIVVVNNNGGGIFSLLPVRRPIEDFEMLFGTPHGVSFEQVAAASGWPYTRAAGTADLLAVLDQPGPRLIEVVTDRRDNASLHRRLTVAVMSAVGAAL